MRIVYLLAQMLIFIALAPLASGIITKIKNNLRFRRGPGIFQPYFNLAKYFMKDEVISDHTSWIFRAAPYIVFAATVSALALVSFPFAGDFIVLIFLLSLGRFFLALAGLDAASAFGGMGSSREMFIASFVEPVVLLSILGVSLSAGTTNLSVVCGARAMTISTFLAVIALFLVTLAETSRVPVDNQETHLELTMVHEAMVLEYSGRHLAMIEAAAALKLVFYFSLFSCLFIPFGMATTVRSFDALLIGFVAYLANIFALAVLLPIGETAVAKMRVFRYPVFLGGAFAAGALAVFLLFVSRGS